ERRRGLDDGQTRAVSAVDVTREAGSDLDGEKGQPPQESVRQRRGQQEAARRVIALEAAIRVQPPEKIALVRGPQVTVEETRQRRLRVTGRDRHDRQPPGSVGADGIDDGRLSRLEIEVEKAEATFDGGGVRPKEGPDRFGAPGGAAGDARWQRMPRRARSAWYVGPDPAGPFIMATTRRRSFRKGAASFLSVARR